MELAGQERDQVAEHVARGRKAVQEPGLAIETLYPTTRAVRYLTAAMREVPGGGRVGEAARISATSGDNGVPHCFC
jgi:hypothetical protein